MGTASHDKSSRKRKRSEIEDQSLQDEKELGGDSQPQNEKSKVLKKSEKGDADKSFEEHKQPKNEKKRKKEKNTSGVVDDDKNQTGDAIDSETRDPKPKKEKKAKKTASNVDHEDLQQNSQKNSKKMKKASAQDENDKDLVKGDVQGKKGKKRKRDSEVGEDISENVKENKKPGNKVKTKGKKKDVEIDLGGVSQPKKERKTKKEKALDGNEEAENEDQELKKENISRTDKLIRSVLDYLHQWKNNAETWKFSKYYQSCLINYLNDPVIINEEDFESCLQYLKKCEGRALKKLKMKAAAVIEESKNSAAKVNKTPECDSDEKKQKKKKKEDSKKNWNDNCILFVKNLPYGQTKDELYHGLRRIFTSASDIRMPFNDKRKHIGFAFIEFSQPSEVTLALSEKKGVRMSGRPLYLDCIGSKNKSFQRGHDDKRHSLSPEYVEAEKLRRANQVIQVFG